MKVKLLFERAYIIPISLIFILLMFITVTVYLSIQEYGDRLEENQRLVNIASDIRYYDEVLTMSANMAVLTGDGRWEERYNGVVEDLDVSLAIAIAMSPESEEYLNAVDLANQRLVDMEMKSFELIGDGQQEQAIDLMFGDDYAYYKSLYSDGLSEFFNALIVSEDLKAQQLEVRIRAEILLILSFVLLTFFILVRLIYNVMSRLSIEQLMGDITQKLASENTQDFNEVMTWVLAAIRDRFKADYVAVTKCDPDNRLKELWQSNIPSDDPKNLYEVGMEIMPYIEQYQYPLMEYRLTGKRNRLSKKDKEIMHAFQVQAYVGAGRLLDNKDLLHIHIMSTQKKRLWYIQKDLVLFESIFKMIIDVINRQNYRNYLYELATIDSLTGVLNRRAFLERMEQAMARVHRLGEVMTVMMMDLDHFKKINDTYGHERGDQVLVDFCQRVRQSLRDMDVFGRLGGEEFSVFLPGTNKEQAMIAATRIMKALEDTHIIDHDGKRINYTVSIGMTEAVKTDKRLEVIMVRADQALYQAKSEGRNRICIEMKEEA